VVEPVKKRRYEAAGRQAASAATRQRIVDTARELILQRGYRAATIGAIAAGAEVNVDTIYQLVGRKPLLLRELIEQAISGQDHAVTAEDRTHVIAIRAEPDPARKLEMYARAIRHTHVRLAPLLLALRDASTTEPEAEEVWREISERRAANMAKLIGDIKETGRLRPGLSIRDGADTVWVMNSPELFIMLTEERGWSLDHYERWLADSLIRLLLQ
jgi:AcrR family transcriptional regulator